MRPIVPLRSLLVPLLLCLICTYTLSLAGCVADTPTPTPEPIELRLATVPYLTQRAQDLTRDFTQDYPYVTFYLSVMPAHDAIEAVADRTTDVALIAEPIQPARNVLEATPIGDLPIVVAVHPSNPVDRLTWDQVHDIFAGQIWDWTMVNADWPAQEITVVSQHAGAASRQVFEDEVLRGESVTPRALVATGDEVAGQLIAEEPAAIGYLLAGIADDRVKALTVEGVTPNAESVAAGTWPLSRPINLVTHVDANIYVLDFLDFSRSRRVTRARSKSVGSRSGRQ